MEAKEAFLFNICAECALKTRCALLPLRDRCNKFTNALKVWESFKNTPTNPIEPKKIALLRPIIMEDARRIMDERGIDLNEDNYLAGYIEGVKAIVEPLGMKVELIELDEWIKED